MLMMTENNLFASAERPYLYICKELVNQETFVSLKQTTSTYTSSNVWDFSKIEISNVFQGSNLISHVIWLRNPIT